MKPCEICGTSHESYQAHVFATNAGATNTATNVATNKANGETPPDQPLIPVGANALGVDSPERRTPNRRSREAYNAYQREYMRKRRLLRSRQSS